MIFDVHALFYFLGKVKGDLLKRFIELILLVLVTYMVSSEFTKDRRTELKYFIFGFGILATDKLLSVFYQTVGFGTVQSSGGIDGPV